MSVGVRNHKTAQYEKEVYEQKRMSDEWKEIDMGGRRQVEQRNEDSADAPQTVENAKSRAVRW